MIWGIFKKAGKRIKEVAKSFKAQILALIHNPEPEVPKKDPNQKKYTIASEAECAMNKGPWCILMSGHAPIFSLFTFFTIVE